MMAQTFSLSALYDALDEKRRARSSTITILRTKRVAEGNSVLHMLLWLDRTPESFVAGYPNALHAALSARR